MAKTHECAQWLVVAASTRIPNRVVLHMYSVPERDRRNKGVRNLHGRRLHPHTLRAQRSSPLVSICGFT